MSELLQQQHKFAAMLPQLINAAIVQGYQVTLGECLRTQAQATANAVAGIGISNSLHLDRLAIDLNLFRDGQYLTATSDYAPLGQYWESIGGTWGGRFNDGNHFSLAYRGRK